MPSKTAAPKPLKQLQDLLPKITHSELLELTELAHEELARRVSTFADAVCEVDEPPVDLVNEALAFASRAETLVSILGCSRRTKDASMTIHYALADLRECL